MSTTTTKDVVARFCKQLANRLGPTKFGLWFENSATIQLQQDGSLRIHVPSDFHADWIEKQFRSELDGLAGDVLNEGAVVSLHVISSDNGAKVTIDRQGEHSHTMESGDGWLEEDHNGVMNGDVFGPQPVQAHAHLPVAMREFVGPNRPERIAPPEQWRPSARSGSSRSPGHHARNGTARINGIDGRFAERYDLQRFIAGPGNDLAFHAAMRLAKGEEAFSPLAIHGGCGLGKTHLLRGICRAFAKQKPGALIRYVTGEDFTNEYITAVRFRKLDQFRNKIRRLDLLAIDDVHFLSNKDKTQGEFLCTLDAIGMTGAQLVLASDQHPKHIAQFQQRLVSRLVSGMVVEVRMPDRATRLRIVKQLAAMRSMRMNEAAAEAVADRCVGSIREIEGTLTRLAAMRDLLYGEKQCAETQDSDNVIGLILVNKVLEAQAVLPLKPIPVRQIVSEISTRCGVPPEQVLGSSRHKRVVLARSLTAYLARQLTTLSYPEIARALGKTNHSTIHAAVKRITNRIESDDRVDLNAEERSVSMRYVIDTLRGAILTAGRTR